LIFCGFCPILNLKGCKNRQEFIKVAQRPDKNILIVGELISIHQGWVEGALESVKITLTK